MTDIQVEKNRWGELEGQIVTGLIVSDEYAARIIPILKKDHLIGSFSQIVARWCSTYYKEYEKAPGKEIENIFRAKQRSRAVEGVDEELIGTFLDNLSRDYEKSEEFNIQYLIDRTLKYFKHQTLQMLSEDVHTYLAQGEEDQAEELVNEYYQIEDDTSTTVNPFDPAVIKQAYASAPKPIIEYPGEYGKLINPVLVRSGFVSFTGIEKRGKSWILMEIAMRAMRQRRSVALFQVGDMDQDQQEQRICTYLTRSPAQAYYAGKVLIPCLDCHHNQTDRCTNKKRTAKTGVLLDEKSGLKMEFKEAARDGYTPCTFCRHNKPKRYQGANWWREVDVKQHTEMDAIKAAKDFQKVMGTSQSFLESQPAGTVTLSHIRSVLKARARSTGFVPDVIVVDYADILAAEKEKEFRHRQNEIWTGLRALSQEYHALVVTATQGAASAYEKESLSIKDFSEDKRKYAHVTAALALNQTDQEREEGIMRVGMLLARGVPFSTKHQVRVLQSLTIGQPFLGGY